MLNFRGVLLYILCSLLFLLDNKRFFGRKIIGQYIFQAFNKLDNNRRRLFLLCMLFSFCCLFNNLNHKVLFYL